MVAVLLRDGRGELLRLLARGATVNESVAAAEEHAECCRPREQQG